MSGAVKPLADVPEFTSLFMHFTNPILGLLAGTFLTAVIQSSSASVGILQALCMTGAVSYGAALPIIMGQNIGTCVTAMISSIGTSKNAKRAALVHLYFNIIGTVVFMTVFYLINAFVHFSFLSDSANAAGIALIHTTFNIVATALLLPFANVLEKLACLTVRDDKEEETLDEVAQDVKALDIRFLDQPSLALEHCKTVTYKMAEQAKKAVELSAGLLFSYDSNTAENVITLETNVDRYEDALGDYMVKLSSRHLSELDSQTLSILLHCIGDFERIADHAVNICEYVEAMQSKEQKFSQKALDELQIYVKATCHIVEITVKVLEKEDLMLALQVEPLEDVIDSLNAEIKKRHIKRLRKGKCTVELGFCLSDIITSLERISDHCENVAISVLQSKDDSFEVHEYKDQLREDYKDIFEQQYRKFHEQYSLPEKKKQQVI
jgi:phosphate:Na+ symporter